MQNVITRTPFRISFIGAGSDMPGFYNKSVGAAVNATIDKYMYILIHRTFDKTYKIRYSKEEEAGAIKDIEHDTAREALKLLKIDPGIEIISISDIPSKGSGLGSSSAYLVGLLNALHAWKGEMVSKEQLSKEAVMIEKDILKEPSGLQDPYAVSFGGLNLYEYMHDERVKVNPIIMKPEDLVNMQDSLMLLYTGIDRNANSILESARRAEGFEELVLRRDMAYKYYDDLISGDWKRTGHWIGEGLTGAGRKGKGQEHGINDIRNRIVELGGSAKNIGSGGGGFLLVYAPKAKRDMIREELGLRELEFNLEFNGTSIVFFN